MECSDLPYTIDFKAVVDAIKEARARRIIIQLPDGLKQYSTTIYNCIVRGVDGGIDVYIHADPNYGACDLQYGQLWATIKPDIIVHIGHSPYPRDLAHRLLEPDNRVGIKVIYVPAFSKTNVEEELLDEAASILKKRGVRRVAMATTSQHVHIIRRIASNLEKRGFNVKIPRGVNPYFMDSQVLGCDYRVPRSVNAEGYIYVGGGVFHPLGLYLASRKPVVKIDPYEGRTIDLTEEGEKLYRIRLYNVIKAMDARNWGLIVGIKTGQYRPWIVERLKKLIQAREGRYVLIASENLSRESLASIDAEWYDAFIVTSCPRLPTDDYWNYHKPVLTPGEAHMALNRVLEPYRFPW